MAARVGMTEMIGAGPRALSRYTGTLLAVFIVQSLVAAVCMIAVAAVLAERFAHLPIFDDAVDGDLVSLITCLRYGSSSFLAIGGIVFGAILLWQLISWFLIGGLAGVLAQRPEGRGETARCFGASGASTYLAYARLALCALPGWSLVWFVISVGLGFALTRIEHALTVGELLGPLALGLLPGALLLHLLWTVEDYARIELSLRHDTHDPSAVMTYLRSFAYVLRHPISLLHAGLGWLIFLAVTLAYAYFAQGHPMYGAEGAITLYVARQGVALVRMAEKVCVIAGQVELARTRPPPPRRIEAKADPSP